LTIQHNKILVLFVSKFAAGAETVVQAYGFVATWVVALCALI